MFQSTERVRKSSLATVNKTGRKTSAVSFVENNTTIEYSDDQTESSGKDWSITVLSIIISKSQIWWRTLLRGKVNITTLYCTVICLTNKNYIGSDEEPLQQRKFSKFNDSLKINKRRLSRDEHGSQTGK